MIKQFPLSFFIVCVLAFILAFLILKYLYKESLGRKDDIINDLRTKLGLQPPKSNDEDRPLTQSSPTTNNGEAERSYLKCVALRRTQVSVGEKGGWVKSDGKRSVEGVTVVFKNVAGQVLYPLVARIAYHRSDGTFYHQVNYGEWLDATKHRSIVLGIDENRELLLAWKLADSSVFASGDKGRVDLRPGGNVLHAEVVFVAGSPETSLQRFSFQIILEPQLSIEEKADVESARKESLSKRLLDIAEHEASAIQNAVAISTGGLLRKDFDGGAPYINFNFYVHNCSVFPISIEDSIGGLIKCITTPIGKRMELFENTVKDCPHGETRYFVIRLWLLMDDVVLIRSTGQPYFRFDQLEIKVKGGEGFPEVGSRSLEIKWIMDMEGNATPWRS